MNMPRPMDQDCGCPTGSRAGPGWRNDYMTIYGVYINLYIYHLYNRYCDRWCAPHPRFRDRSTTRRRRAPAASKGEATPASHAAISIGASRGALRISARRLSARRTSLRRTSLRRLGAPRIGTLRIGTLAISVLRIRSRCLRPPRISPFRLRPPRISPRLPDRTGARPRHPGQRATPPRPASAPRCRTSRCRPRRPRESRSPR